MTAQRATTGLPGFLGESLRIEGILRGPTSGELEAAERFLSHGRISGRRVQELQAALAPGFPIRDRPEMRAFIGEGHEFPPGGMALFGRFGAIVHAANVGWDPWQVHCDFLALHPFADGNGRTARVLWAWNMRKVMRDPFRRGFLHEFYYQTLQQRDGGAEDGR